LLINSKLSGLNLLEEEDVFIQEKQIVYVEVGTMKHTNFPGDVY